MMEDGVKGSGNDGKFRVMELIELVHEAMGLASGEASDDDQAKAAEHLAPA
jgi:hypothetical protein